MAVWDETGKYAIVADRIGTERNGSSGPELTGADANRTDASRRYRTGMERQELRDSLWSVPFDVALVTPSLNRPQWHEQLYAQFLKQVGLASKHLYVLDESAEPSPFFSTPRDGVTYVQQAGKPRVDGVTRIGEARNALNALVKEPIIVHVDDDDLLDPLYAATMCERLGDADVAKLDVWRLIKDDDSVIFEWDTRSLGGQHYAMKGDVVEPVVIDPKEMTTEEHQAWQSAWRDGFGWSMVYTRAIWEKVKFAVEGTEDIDWVRRVRAAGGKIRFISDLPHLALHTVTSSRTMAKAAARTFRSACSASCRAV